MSRNLVGGGQIFKPQDYHAHWIVEFDNGEKVFMFNQDGKKVGIFENIVRGRHQDICYAIWEPINDRIPRIGVLKKGVGFAFIIGSELIKPIDEFYRTCEFQFVRLFIRNNILITSNNGLILPDSDQTIEYYAEIKCIRKKISKEFKISWDGKKIKNEGFKNIEHIGVVKIT